MRNEISGQIVDVMAGTIFPGTIVYENGQITEIKKNTNAPDVYIMPGFIDAHIHIESSMLIPSEFARMVVPHGTVATVSDPHEIGNVLGIDGVLFMIENAKTVPMHFYFGAPSCVPATTFETSGATLDSNAIKQLLEREDVFYLSEMMNYPGVINRDPEVMNKIKAAHQLKKPVDGHAPGLRGKDLDTYLSAGISTDHEAYTYEEGKEKIAKGMKVLIREGSAARNFEALIPLLGESPDFIMFCTDDKNEGYEQGHINSFLKWAVEKGYSPMSAIRAATRNPVLHYGLKTGLLQKGDPATFVVVKNLKDFEVLETYIDGIKVASHGKPLFKTKPAQAHNKFNRHRIQQKQLQVPVQGTHIRVIEAIEGELITREGIFPTNNVNGLAESDLAQDVLKLVVVNRYEDAPPAVAFIKNFGLKRGAIGATVAHDSHNIIAVGVDDASLKVAINALIESKGGLVAVDAGKVTLLPLPVAGLMSLEAGEEVSKKYQVIKNKAHELGSTLKDPFMTLSFMALLVIPEIKLSDKGLFDCKKFEFINLFTKDS